MKYWCEMTPPSHQFFYSMIQYSMSQAIQSSVNGAVWLFLGRHNMMMQKKLFNTISTKKHRYHSACNVNMLFLIEHQLWELSSPKELIFIDLILNIGYQLVYEEEGAPRRLIKGVPIFSNKDRYWLLIIQ